MTEGSSMGGDGSDASMGRDPRKCSARRSDGGLCEKFAMSGQRVCRKHGGAAPQARAAAERRVVEGKARAVMVTYGGKIETTATEALLEEVQRTAGHVAWLGDRVREIESEAAVAGSDGEHPLVWGVTKSKSGGEDRGVTEEAVPSVWLKLYQQERTHLVRVCSEAIRAGIEERRVRLAEAQGALIAQAIRSILGDLQLSPEQQARVSEVVPRHLRALSAGGA
jgi:hypothetical protein